MSPQATGIRFLLGHVYDRRGRVDRSLDLVASVAPQPTDLPSARRRYDEWPTRLLDEARADVWSAAADVMPDWEVMVGAHDE